MSSPLLLSKLLLLNLENYSNFGLNEGERRGGLSIKTSANLKILLFSDYDNETMYKKSLREEKSAKNCSKCI